MRIRRWCAAVATVVAVLAAPAATYAHGVYNPVDANATATDGHFVLFIAYGAPNPPEGYAAGDMVWGPTCYWSDGSVDDCGELIEAWGL